MFLLHFGFWFFFLRYGFIIPVIIIYFTLISSIYIYNYIKTFKKTMELKEQHEPAIFLTTEDSFSSKSMSRDERYYDDNGHILTTTDIFKCRNCKQRKCLSWQLIPRYEEDPITTFVECVRCGYKWKF